MAIPIHPRETAVPTQEVIPATCCVLFSVEETAILPPAVLLEQSPHHHLLPAVHPVVLALLLAAAPRYAVFKTITETMTGFVNYPATLESLFTTCNSLHS